MKLPRLGRTVLVGALLGIVVPVYCDSDRALPTGGFAMRPALIDFRCCILLSASPRAITCYLGRSLTNR